MVSSAFCAGAQSDYDPEQTQQSTSLNPGSEKKFSAPSRLRGTLGSKKISKRGEIQRTSHIETEEEYVARMKKTVKLIRKQEKLMQKPQYSNPLYFGHKRPPKKHKPSKMRFCTECGIRH
jgi:hypothetical protein